MTLHRLWGLVCHQDPLRCLAVGEVTLPVCSRCLGIYLSFGIAWLLLVLLRARASRTTVVIGALLLLGGVVQAVAERWGLSSTDNATRLLVGGACGVGLASLSRALWTESGPLGEVAPQRGPAASIVALAIPLLLLPGVDASEALLRAAHLGAVVGLLLLWAIANLNVAAAFVAERGRRTVIILAGALAIGESVALFLANGRG